MKSTLSVPDKWGKKKDVTEIISDKVDIKLFHVLEEYWPAMSAKFDSINLLFYGSEDWQREARNFHLC